PMPARTPAAPPPSLESKIGAQWLNRIGIVAVLIGVSYFLKYAFENNWIGPAGRIAIGLLAGAGVVLWSESFRKHGYRVFSYSLKALGVGILYLSLWGAFQIYHLIPSEAAFAGMILITGFTATLALKEDAEIIAAFAVAGAFSTPLLLATGENHELALFSYVTLLDAAVLALIAYKPWKRLLMGAFFGTLILYAGWSDRYYNSSELETTLLFASIFFVVFAIAPLVAGSAASAKSMTAAPPVSLIIVSGLNAVAYFLQIVAMLDYLPSKDSQPLLAWAAVAIAAIYIVLSRMIQQRLAGVKSAALIPLLYLAIAVGFLTIAVPLKMNAHWVTIGWFIESAVLMWIGERTDRDLLRFFGVAAVALGVLRLVFYDNFHPTRLIFNARFATYAVAIAVLAAIVYYAARHPKYSGGAAAAVVAINVLALLGMTYEINDFFARRMNYINYLPAPNWQDLRVLRNFSFSALYMAYGAVLMTVGFLRRSAFLRWQALVLLALTIGKVFTYDVWELEQGYRIISFIVLGVLLLAISFVYQRDWLKLSGTASDSGLAKGSSAS